MQRAKVGKARMRVGGADRAETNGWRDLKRMNRPSLTNSREEWVLPPLASLSSISIQLHVELSFTTEMCIPHRFQAVCAQLLSVCLWQRAQVTSLPVFLCRGI